MTTTGNEYPGAAVDKSGTATARWTVYVAQLQRVQAIPPFYVGGGFGIVSLTVEVQLAVTLDGAA